MTDNQITEAVRKGLWDLCDMVRPYCGSGLEEYLIVLATNSKIKDVKGTNFTIAISLLRSEIEESNFDELLKNRIQSGRKHFSSTTEQPHSG